jgi:glycine cleavage system H lipoate-binding protein
MDGGKKKNGFPLIPDGDVPCVWMDAGMVAYKICDRNLDCEHCPLDMSLRGETRLPKDAEEAPGEEAAASFFQPLAQFQLDARRFYHPGHTWISVENSGRVKIGLDDFLSVVLGSIDAVSLPRPGEAVETGRGFAEIVQGPHCFSLRAPLSGTIRERNEALADGPGLLSFDPLGKGWLAIVEPDDLKADLRRCRTGRRVFSWTLKDMDWVNASAAAASGKPRDELGRTAFDGGTMSRDLRELLPPDRYAAIVDHLLQGRG